MAVPVLSLPSKRLISGARMAPVISKVKGFSSASSQAMVRVVVKVPATAADRVTVKVWLAPMVTEVIELVTE